MKSVPSPWRGRLPALLANFIYTLHYAAILYINSSFLSTFYSWQTVAFLYALGSAADLILLSRAPTLVRRFGNRTLFTVMVILEVAATVGLALSTKALWAAVFFIVYSAVSMIVFYSLDIALEAVTENRRTGEVRGAYLTMANLAYVLAPLIVAWRAFGSRYAAVYASAAIVLAPLLLVAPYFKQDGHHLRETHFPLKRWWANRAVRLVTLARGLLEFFYALMVIYMPIYLHAVVGFDWREIGVIFAVMLLAFLLFEWPVGELADRFFGEREMMAEGFLVMAISLLLMLHAPGEVALWAGLLFLSRLGATLTEMTCEAYFFKHVSSEDAGYISIYRATRPGFTILAAAVGAAVLAFSSFTHLFIVLAAVMALGALLALRLVDTN